MRAYRRIGSGVIAWIGGLALLAGFLSIAPAGQAGSLESDVLGLFPKDASEAGYADLEKIRAFPWFPQFEAQVVPVSLFGFEQWLSAAEMRQGPSVNEVAWARIAAGGGESLVGVALGDFDVAAVQSYLAANNNPFVSFEDQRLYAAQSGSGDNETFFTFLDGHTILFGPRDGLEQILDDRRKGSESLLANEEIMRSIGEASGGLFWDILQSARAQEAVLKVMPGAGRFSVSPNTIGKIGRASIEVAGEDDLQVSLKVSLDSEPHALALSQLFQAGVVYELYEQKTENPGLAGILSAAAISASGSAVNISLSVSADQMVSLIEHNTF